MLSLHSQALAFISATPLVRSKVRDCLEELWPGAFRIASSISSKRLDIFEFEYLIIDFDKDFFSSKDDLLRQIKKTDKTTYIFTDLETEKKLAHLIKLFPKKVFFVSKPSGPTIKNFIEELVKVVETIKLSHSGKSEFDFPKGNFLCPELIAIGASTGGPEAINALTKSLSQNMPPILIVLHMKANLMGIFCKRLQSLTQLKVVEITSREQIGSNSIFIASGDHHMIVEKKGGMFFLERGDKTKVNGHCPSVDTLFNSISEIHDCVRVGILLTGMGSDGALGLLNLKKAGALTVAQDESTAAVYGMPKAAVDLDAANYILSLDEITQLLQSFAIPN